MSLSLTPREARSLASGIAEVARALEEGDIAEVER